MRRVGPGTGELTVRSRLRASPEQVWARAVSAAGIRDEMRPLVRMTLPRGLDRLDPQTVTLGESLGRSWLLLFGVIPFDYDDITLERLEPGHSFLERSTMLSQRLWEHQRTLESAPGGCVITDRVAWEPRLRVPPRALSPVIGLFFRHRHKRLRRRFGGEAL